MPKLHIRPATAADRSTLLTFHRALYIQHRDRFLEPELAPLYAYRDLDSALRDDVDAILTAGDSVALIAEHDARAIGYITGHIENDPRRVLRRKGVIEDWFVEQGERGQGVGAELAETLISIFRESGCEVVESATWATNEGARAVHSRLGFHEIEVKMRMRIAEASDARTPERPEPTGRARGGRT